MAKQNNEIQSAVVGGITRAFAYHIGITYIVPVAAPLFAIALGLATGVPWFWIFLGALAAFAFVSTGLFRFHQWREARSPANKLGTPVPAIAVDEASTTKLIKVGLAVPNQAQFPMEIRIEKMATQIADRVPKEPFFPRSVTVGIAGAATFTNATIDIETLERADKVIFGTIDAQIAYGLPGSPTFTLEYQRHLAFKFDADGKFVGMDVSTTPMTEAVI